MYASDNAKKQLIVVVSVVSLFALLAAFRTGSTVAQEVQPAIEDLTPPELVSLEIYPDLIDTDLMDVMITVTVRITDDLSGVNNVYVNVAPTHDMLPGSPPQYYGNGASFDPAQRDVTIDIPISILQYSREGEWGIWLVYLEDRIRNRSAYYNALDGTLDGLGNPQEPYCERSTEALCLPSELDQRFINYPGIPLGTPTPTPTDVPEPTPTVPMTPIPVCTPPPCPSDGRLLCPEANGCPGGCGYVCRFGVQLPHLSN